MNKIEVEKKDIESCEHNWEGINNASKEIGKKLADNFIVRINRLSDSEIVEIGDYLSNINQNRDRYSKGSEWFIYKIALKDKEDNLKEYIIAKKRYDNLAEGERAIHQKIQEIISQKNIDIGMIDIPRLRALLNIKGEQFIVMDFVKGKTLYHILIEKILEKNQINDVFLENDNAAESMFFKAFGLNPHSPIDQEKARKLYSQQRQGIKLFETQKSLKYTDSVTKFLSIIHDKNIYHRDLANPRNIIFWDDGKLYIIDFWKSIEVDNPNALKSDIYEQQEWEITWVYDWDESLIWILKWLAKTEEDLEIERENQNIKRMIKKISQSDRLYDVLWEIPKEWNKQKNKILDTIKTLWNKAKHLSINDLKDAKSQSEITALLLTQSYENISYLLENIENQKKILTKNINSLEIKKNQIPVYILRSGIWKEEYQNKYSKEIEKTNKDLFFWEDIETKIVYLKKIADKQVGQK